jgi:hypothetical protein
METREEATVRMVASRARWTHAVLPLRNVKKGTEGWPMLGYLTEPVVKGAPITVVVGNIFGKTAVVGVRPTETYPNIEAAMAAGWRVD